MFKKSLFYIMLFSLLSGHAVALTIHKGHLVSHKEWATNNAKGVFQTTLASQEKSKRYHVDGIGGDQISASSQIDPAATTVGQPVKFSGSGYVVIYNGTDTAKNYFYRFVSCSEHDDHGTECNYYMNQVELESGGELIEGLASQEQLVYNTKGHYQIEYDTSVAMDGYRSIAGSHSRDTLTVS